LGRHSEECGHSKGHSCRNGILIEPEGDPRYNDQHTAGDVDLDQVVAKFSLEEQVHLETTVLSCNEIETITLLTSYSFHQMTGFYDTSPLLNLLKNFHGNCFECDMHFHLCAF